jgi:D-hydroxyproline dehydrogenase subunit gamma
VPDEGSAVTEGGSAVLDEGSAVTEESSVVTADARPCARRLPGVARGTPVTITVNGRPLDAYEGESIAAALLAAGRRTLRRTPLHQAPRGFFCGMGICFDCLVMVDGIPNVRGCLAEVRAGVVVEVAGA